MNQIPISHPDHSKDIPCYGQDKLVECGRSILVAGRQSIWHSCQDGTPATRARKSGFGGNFIGENVAFGNEGANEVFGQWYRSPGHHRNMLRGEYNSIGVARSVNYWTQLFGNSEREELLVMK